MKVIICYHKYCRDGWVAAAIAYKYYLNKCKEISEETNVFFLALFPEEVTKTVDKLVETEDSSTAIRFFDLAFASLDTVKKLMGHFEDVYVADHHKTTQEIFRKSPQETLLPSITVKKFEENKIFIFDNDMCGASLAWKFYYPNTEVPIFVKYIQDRDNWTWIMPNSRIINIGLYEMLRFKHTNYDEITDIIREINPRSYLTFWGADISNPGKINHLNIIPDFREWSPYLHSDLYNDEWIAEATKIGKMVDNLQYRERNQIRYNADLRIWNNKRVYFCNSSSHVSNLGEDLYKEVDEYGNYKCDFALIWRYNHKENLCHIGLRSRKKGECDVSAIAKEYGGGGHKSSAGFSCTLDEFQSILKSASK